MRPRIIRPGRLGFDALADLAFVDEEHRAPVARTHGVICKRCTPNPFQPLPDNARLVHLITLSWRDQADDPDGWDRLTALFDLFCGPEGQYPAAETLPEEGTR